MKTLLLLAAALTATPAAAEIYLCRSAQGHELAVQAEMAGNRLAMHDNKGLTILCGRGAAAGCQRLSDSGYAYRGERGLIQFVPPSVITSAPAYFRMQAPGETVWTSYMCRVTTDAGVRRRFRG